MLFEYSKETTEGQLKAGMSREEVRKVFHSKVYEFLKTPLCELTTDAFYEIDVHVHYDQKTNKLIGIEIYQPNRIYYKENVILLEKDFKHLMRILNTNKLAYERDILGLSLENKKLGVYVPHDEDESPECASVFVHLTDGGSLIIKEK